MIHGVYDEPTDLQMRLGYIGYASEKYVENILRVNRYIVRRGSESMFYIHSMHSTDYGYRYDYYYRPIRITQLPGPLKGIEVCIYNEYDRDDEPEPYIDGNIFIHRNFIDFLRYIADDYFEKTYPLDIGLVD